MPSGLPYVDSGSDSELPSFLREELNARARPGVDLAETESVTKTPRANEYRVEENPKTGMVTLHPVDGVEHKWTLIWLHGLGTTPV